MKYINGLKMSVDSCELFIDWWNHFIDLNGYVTLYDVRVMLMNFNREAKFTDMFYGWDERISFNDFIMRPRKFIVECELNLPEYGLFDFHNTETQR